MIPLENKENLIKLSKLPTKDILYTQTLSAIASPLYNLLWTLQANSQKLIFILNQKAKGGE